MAKRLDKQDIVSLNIVRPYHVSQSVDAFTGIVAYDINVSGSFQVTGSTILSGSTYIKTLTNTSQTNLVTINPTTGQLFYTASSAIGSTDTNIGNSNLSVPSSTTRTLSIPNGSVVVFSGSFEQGVGNSAGTNAHAEGFGTQANGDYSHAEGYETTASGFASHAEGDRTVASGYYSHAEGNSTTASGDYSHAEGNSTTAFGDYSHAEGYQTIASGAFSHAEGVQTVARGNYSYAGGTNTIASGSYQTVVGSFNAHGDTTSRFIVGGGASDGSRKDALIVTSNNDVGINTSSPTGKLTAVGSTGYLSYRDTNAAGNLLQLSGSSNQLVRIDVAAPSGSGINTISYGIRGGTEATYAGYGKTGDAFVYASGDTNGFNIINQLGPDRENYIRFYAGKDTNGTIPDIHIQGSGTTRGNVGINTTTPTGKLTVKGISGSLSYDEYNPSSPYSNNALILSGSSNNLTRMDVSTQVDASNIGTISHGVRGFTNPTFDGYGSQGDAFIYASSETNGFNIISQVGTNKPSYIRLYAGQNATGGTPQIHIQGTGSTVGYVGINTPTPQANLHVNGSLIASGSFAGGQHTIVSGSYQTAVGQFNTHGDATSRFIVGGGASDGSRADAFKVTSNNTIVVPTQSSAPSTFIGIEGEMVPVHLGGQYYLYVFINGRWRRTSLDAF